MSVELVHCPACGGPLEPAGKVVYTTCSYCGSRLQLARHAAGYIVAIPDDIRDDANFLARRAATQHLRGRLGNLVAEREMLKERGESEVMAAVHPLSSAWANRVLWGWLLVFIFSIASAISLFMLYAYTTDTRSLPEVRRTNNTAGLQCSGLSLGLLGLGVYLIAQAGGVSRRQTSAARKAAQDAKDRYGPRLAELDDGICSTQTRLAELSEAMDRLAGQL